MLQTIHDTVELFEDLTELEESSIQGGQTNFFIKCNFFSLDLQLTGTGGLFAPAFPYGNLITQVLIRAFGRTVYAAPKSAVVGDNGVGFYFSYISDDPFDILGLNGVSPSTAGPTPFD